MSKAYNRRYGQLQRGYRIASELSKLGNMGYGAYKTGKYIYDYAKPKPRRKRRSKPKKASSFNRPTRRAPRSFPKKVKAQIRELKRLTESDMGTLTYRKLENGTWDAKQNEQGIQLINGSTNTTVEAALAQLRYYNPSAPSTLVTADGTTGTYNKEFLVRNTHSTLMLKNSFMVPCNVSVYLCRPKRDTSITPSTSWQDGLTDTTASVTTTSILVYPTDSSVFTDLWSIEKKKTYYMPAGKKITCTHSEKAFQYEPSVNDEHALTYQRKNKSFVWMVVIHGDMSHDSVAPSTQLGTTKVSLDYLVINKYVINYAAGADIRFLHVDTSELTSQTTSALTGVIRIPDNVGNDPT